MIMLLLLAPNLPFLSPVFGDHMVLQRDKVNTFWGWANPGDKVTVQISGSAVSGVAAEDGKWTVKVKPPKVGGPYTVKVSGPQSVELKDVLVGDVWVCSGQSNMEMGVGMARDPQKEIAAANYPNIRLFTVPKSPALTPRTHVTGQWLTCSPSTITQNGWGGFSAVAYYFGRKLHQELKVPIGLVHTSWGGTSAEAWTSEEGLAPVKDFDKDMKLLASRNADRAPTTFDELENWATRNGGDFVGESVDDSAWQTCTLPAMFGNIGLGQHRGVVWFRKTIELDSEPTGDVQIVTGSNQGLDATYINGKLVGGGNSVLVWRQTVVPKGVLKKGTNTIAIRFIAPNGGSGFQNGADGFRMYFSDRAPLELSGQWKMLKGVKLSEATALPPIIDQNPNFPTTLHNGMLHPLQPLAMKGAIWYQGETNIGRGEQYSRLLPAMITDWRKGFGQGDFPFYVVQLANFGGRRPNPSESAWSELREAQAKAVKNTKNTGLAVIIDIGEGADIHPKNKQDVGGRLALLALNRTYKKKVEDSGPTLKSATPTGGALVLKFDHAQGMMLLPAQHSSFAIAGEDGKFVWATAVLSGDTITLTSPQVPEPKYVRYAWDDDPFVTLVNGAGLPAGPFRTK